MTPEDYLRSPAFEDWPADESILVELGRLMSVWGGLEAGLNVAIGKLAGFDNVGDVRPMILTTHSSFPQRVDNFTALCEQLEGQFPNLKGYQEVAVGIRKVQVSRNKYAHNMVIKDRETGKHMISRFSARGKVVYYEEEVEIADIRRITAQTHAVSLKLHALLTGVSYPPIWDRV